MVYDTVHDLADVRNILLHETAHGSEWKAIAIRISCDRQRCHTLELKPHAQVLACVMCGHVNALRHCVCRRFWNSTSCLACRRVGSVTSLSRQTWLTITETIMNAPPTAPDSTV